jgi:nitroimidazol reductase NimA-like FMN-containing flavoprotein (pyridoxamine 5'-phosphate oxidase superfamily)
MTKKEPVAERLPSKPEHPAPTPWSEARKRLAGGQWYWLATVRPDGRPHVMPLLTVWVDGTLHFCASPASRKAKNLAHHSRCVITTASEGAHLVVEGEATKVRDEARLERVAEVYTSKYGWQPTVRDGAFYADGAPTAGSPPYELYEVTPTKAFGFGEETFRPTRWRF